MPDPSLIALTAEPPSTAVRAGIWRIRVLGALEARDGDIAVTRFASHAIAALLARLAMQPDRVHSREELIELLWPGVEIDVGRNRLRNALSSLRSLLQPPGRTGPAVLLTDRQSVRLAPGAMRCDAVEFERCVQTRRMDEAQACDGGELLPGFYDDWVQVERGRIAALRERVETALASRPVERPAIRGGALVARASRWVPGYLTSFFGREDERRWLVDAIARHRLVTVSGPGGAGKTRLAVEVARQATGFELVAFVALADCESASQCGSQVRVALQLPPGGGEALDSVVAYLSSGQALLVLDNFEQLVATGGRDTVETLLRRVPGLHLLVTSRRVLGVAGERELALGPLPAPDPEGGLLDVARNASVGLFVDRARGVRPDFQVTARNHVAVASLCSALDGLPLAIELAASRSRAFSPQDMLEALTDGVALLARPGMRHGKVPQRHDSLHAAIDWSWRLLTTEQQRFLLALSVFRGGWSPASARAVCEEPEAHELLEALAADSLLRAEPDAAGSMRFGMLETIRQFLQGRMAPDEKLAMRHRHREHYLVIACAQESIHHRGFELELPNFTEALHSALDDGDPGFALSLGLALRSCWETHGIAPETLSLLRRALAAADRDAPAWVACCTMTALLFLSAGQVAAALERVADALAVAPPASLARAAALCARVRVLSETRRDGTGLAPHLDEAMAIALAAGSVELQALCLGQMCILKLRQKQDVGQADALALQARTLYQSIGRDREACAMLFERTMCLLALRQFEDALALSRTFERESAALEDGQQQLRAINQQGVIQAGMRRWTDALASYRRCAQMAWQSHNHYWLAFALWNHCRNLARLRQPEPAARMMAFSERYWVTHFGALAADDARFVRQVRALVRHQLGSARLESLWDEGLRWSSAQALEVALGHPLT